MSVKTSGANVKRMGGKKSKFGAWMAGKAPNKNASANTHGLPGKPIEGDAEPSYKGFGKPKDKMMKGTAKTKKFRKKK